LNKTIEITFSDKTVENYSEGITLLELSKYYQPKMINPIVGARVDNIVLPLTTRITKNCKIEFFDVNDITGQSIYVAGLKYILIVAIKELFKDSEVIYLNSLDKAIYTEITNEILSDDKIKLIEEKMQEIIKMDFPFEKITVNKKEAVNYCYSIYEEEKAKNILNIPDSTAVFYKLKNYYNYFYVDLPKSTGVINKFKLHLVDENHLMLMFPTARSNNEIPEFIERPKVLETFNKYRYWLNMTQSSYAADLNKIISQNGIKDFIRMNALYLGDQLINITKEIIDKKDQIKVILLAGPSSSGKTTTSHKLALYLKAGGLNPIRISVDDYYKEREDTPKNELGEYEFDIPEALDMDLLNKQLKEILEGKEVSLPKYNFFTGKKEYNGRIIKLEKNDIIIMEGLYCLKDELSSLVPNHEKYKIYISPFMGMRIDKHNYISTSDLRLLRRIVRDAVYRGFDVEYTMKTWQSVRKGEELYIFPDQNNADAIINTASAYDLGVLKIYAEPLLYSVPINSKYYEEARRLLGFLRIYFPISSEYVPQDEILREFVGGSVFDPH